MLVAIDQVAGTRNPGKAALLDGKAVGGFSELRTVTGRRAEDAGPIRMSTVAAPAYGLPVRAS